MNYAFETKTDKEIKWVFNIKQVVSYIYKQAGDWTHSLTQDRQVLNHWATAPHTFSLTSKLFFSSITNIVRTNIKSAYVNKTPLTLTIQGHTTVKNMHSHSG